MKACEIVCTHDPDKIYPWIIFFNESQRLSGESEAVGRFESGYPDSGIADHIATELNTAIKSFKILVFLEWIARSDHPPDLIKLQAPYCDFRHQQMTLVGRVEGAAKQADLHAAFDVRHA